jgi:hypothetical protein
MRLALAVEFRVMAARHMMVTGMQMAFVDNIEALWRERIAQLVPDSHLDGSCRHVSLSESAPIAVNGQRATFP